MSVFAFTFGNRLALFDLLSFQLALVASSIAAAMPAVAHLSFPESESEDQAAMAWPRWWFATLLCGAATLCAFNAGPIVLEATKLSGLSQASPVQFISVITAVVGLGLVGVSTLLGSQPSGTLDDAP